uniref:Uncharacterized protein n=1 Tax=Hyaloperonospora arabidopsidis (strain Emoy2) TaxID=559515 RepID=M4BW61_HYAAE
MIVMRVWCPAHQVNLFMEAGFAMIDDEQFVEGPNRWSVHLSHQVYLVNDFVSACPKLTNRWVIMGHTIN